MNRQHYVVLRIALRCDEMDGSPEETAEVMLDLVEQALGASLVADCDVEVSEHGEVKA
jgi:hypothetical protein